MTTSPASRAASRIAAAAESAGIVAHWHTTPKKLPAEGYLSFRILDGSDVLAFNAGSHNQLTIDYTVYGSDPKVAADTEWQVFLALTPATSRQYETGVSTEGGTYHTAQRLVDISA